MFTSDVEPILRSSCIACHASAAGVGPGFMAPIPDVYTTITHWPGGLVVGGKPNDSRLYTYATSTNHSSKGTNLTPDQAEIVRRWITIVPPLEDLDAGPSTQT